MKQKTAYFLLFLLCWLFQENIFAQCNDDIDLPENQLIDYYDKEECVCEDNANKYFGRCQPECIPSPVKDWELDTLWETGDNIVFGSTDPLLIADLNEDNEPEIVATSAGSKDFIGVDKKWKY